MPIIPKTIIKNVASRYIAGSYLQDAIDVTKQLNAEGGQSTIDVLGEFVTEKDRAMNECGNSMKVLKAIHDSGVRGNLSIKPTSLGCGIDFDFGFKNVMTIMQQAKEYDTFVRIDMENIPYTDMTLKLYKAIRDAGYDNVGIVIQARLFRSENDIISLKDYKPQVRLCKGIYKESPDISWTEKQPIRDNWKKLLGILLTNGSRVGIATHDDELINYAMNYIKEHNITKEQYEFQMLLGVRENKRAEIIKKGYDLRVYVPFGVDWYGYSTRRLEENPDMAGHIFKAFFTGGKN